MIKAFKAIKGFNRVEKKNWYKEISEDARPTRATSTIKGGEVIKKEAILKVERARLEIRRNFFSIRAAIEWNGLPEEVKKCTSINGFKDSYDRWRNNQQNTDGADMTTVGGETNENFPGPS